MSDASPDSDVDVDLFSFSALQRAPSDIRPPDIPPPTPPTELIQPSPPPLPPTTPTAVDVSEAPKPSRRGRVYPSVGSVPEISEETLARSPKLRQWRERERNRINAAAYRKREAEARRRVAGRKLKVCRACFRVYPPVGKRLQSPYCTRKCGEAWVRVVHCFDGEAAWLHRIAECRRILAHPDKHGTEMRLAAEHTLTHAAPDYSPHEPRPGTIQSALMKAIVKLRSKWAPFAAEAIRNGSVDSALRPDMLAVLAPMVRGDGA